MLGHFMRAALIFLVAVLLDTIGATFSTALLTDVADPSNLPTDAPPLVDWGHLFADWFLEMTIFSLLIYLLVAAWLENQSTRGF